MGLLDYDEYDDPDGLGDGAAPSGGVIAPAAVAVAKKKRGGLLGLLAAAGQHVSHGLDNFIDTSASAGMPGYDPSLLDSRQRSALKWKYLADLGRGIAGGAPALPLDTVGQQAGAMAAQRYALQRQQVLNAAAGRIMGSDMQPHEKYGQMSQLFASIGDVEKANTYGKLSHDLTPAHDEFGAAQFGRDAQGNPIAFQVSKDGRTRVMNGVLPQAQTQVVNTGGAQNLIDTQTGRPIAQFGNTVSPDTQQTNDVRRDEMAQRGQQFRQQLDETIRNNSQQNGLGWANVGLGRDRLTQEGQLGNRRIDVEQQNGQRSAMQPIAHQLDAVVQFQEALDDYAKTLQSLGTQAMPTTEAKALLQSQHKTVQMLGKNYFQLGVLSDSDAKLLNGVLTDPTTFMGSLTGRNAILKQASAFRGMLDGREAHLRNVLQNGIQGVRATQHQLWEKDGNGNLVRVY
jgi:hypothetical protein